MKIVRFESCGKIHYGTWRGERHANLIVGELFGRHRVTDRALTLDRLLAPFVPRDILCIGLNYRAHAAESGAKIPSHPVLFIKSSNALAGPGDAIHIPASSTTEPDYECELAVVIGKTCRHVKKEDALDHVFGYTCANDISARDWQRNKDMGGGQWSRAKSLDGFCPIGPWIVTRDEIPNPGCLRLRTLLNGEVMQDSNTSDMIFDVPTIISDLSQNMTLNPGTLILTGTPQGVGFARKPPVWLKRGDRVTIEIENIGELTNTIA